MGLDPGLPEQRNEYIIPVKYLKEDYTKARLNFCLDVLEEFSDY